MNTLPLFSYPLTVAIIDDDSLFLEALTSLLEKQYPLKIFNTPLSAVDFFETYTPLLSSLKLIRGCTELENYDVSGHLPIDLNLTVSKELISNPLRTEELSVLIVDYNMPGMNGLELCRKLKSFPMKKILLTGEGSDQLAITAFNEGIIDCFIRKESLSLPEDITLHLNSLNQAYLSNNTKHLVKHLETDHLLPVSDPEFISFFNEWCQAHRIKECYVIDQNANFMLIDEHNVTSFFITHTERTLNNFIELHEDDHDASSFVQAVKLREQIPFFGEGKESWGVDVSKWGDHFETPKILVGREPYYWSIFNNV
jgi:CheY-like chemotaxis protein